MSQSLALHFCIYLISSKWQEVNQRIKSHPSRDSSYLLALRVFSLLIQTLRKSVAWNRALLRRSQTQSREKRRGLPHGQRTSLRRQLSGMFLGTAARLLRFFLSSQKRTLSLVYEGRLAGTLHPNPRTLKQKP